MIFINALKRIISVILVLSVIFAFASCKREGEGEQNTDNSTRQTSTTNKATSTTENDEIQETQKADLQKKENLVGTWDYTETVTPQSFYTDFYNSEITKTDVKMVTRYKFNNNGTFAMGINIENISEVRKEYRALMVAAARKKAEAKGRFLTSDEVIYYEGRADEVLKEICAVKKGTYLVNGDKLYFVTADETYYETFVLNGDELTLTGSSKSNKGYPITMLKK